MSDAEGMRARAALHHRAAIGGADKFDLIGALQFGLLTCKLGMREHHTLLDVGCGSLRGGRLFIPYLAPGHYYGIEPNVPVLEAGMREEVGQDQLERKRPVFSNDSSFTLTAFGRRFDYILAQSIFSHATRAQIKRCLQEAALVMHPTSMLTATYNPGEVSEDRESWGWALTVRYRPQDMEQWAADAGLSCEPLDWQHPTQKWLLFRLVP